MPSQVASTLGNSTSYCDRELQFIDMLAVENVPGMLVQMLHARLPAVNGSNKSNIPCVMQNEWKSCK